MRNTSFRCSTTGSNFFDLFHGSYGAKALPILCPYCESTVTVQCPFCEEASASRVLSSSVQFRVLARHTAMLCCSCVLLTPLCCCVGRACDVWLSVTDVPQGRTRCSLALAPGTSQ